MASGRDGSHPAATAAGGLAITPNADAGRRERNRDRPRQHGRGGDIQPRRGRVCSAPGCTREYLRASHHHCCSMCSVGGHTDRCDMDWHKYSRRQRRAQERTSRGQLTACSIQGCLRVSGLGHHTCCSACEESQGVEHTIHCTNRQQFLHVQGADTQVARAQMLFFSGPGDTGSTILPRCSRGSRACR